MTEIRCEELRELFTFVKLIDYENGPASRDWLLFHSLSILEGT